MDEPSGTIISFAYDADGNRTSKAVSSGGTTTTVKDVYQLGHLAYQTDGNGTILASFTYDSHGVPTSVTVGSDPMSAPRYYYVYNGHGDVIGLVDANGNAVATYAYDAWGVVTINTESFSNGWHNPYLYDGRDSVRYDGETGLYWMSVRVYDPTLGRFISRDPLGRAPLMGWTTQPYAYAGNNPLLNVDPSGRLLVREGAGIHGDETSSGSTAIHPRVRDTQNTNPLGSWQDCIGHRWCVIELGGVPVGLPKHPNTPGGTEKFWLRWSDQLAGRMHGNVGFIRHESTDAYEGADWLNRQLRHLARGGFHGRVSVAAHSNGAAALFTYMAGVMLGMWGGGSIISKWVAMDAPVGEGGLLWAGWSWDTVALHASTYCWVFGVKGIYAWNAWDIASGPVLGDWLDAEYWRVGGIEAAHLSLVEDPDPYLVNFLV